MIITCPNCNKKFQIDATLVPEEGRNLQCGSCEHVWFYKAQNEDSSLLTLNKDLINNEIKDNLPKKEIENIIDNNKSSIQEKSKNEEKIIKDTSYNKKIEKKNESSGGKFFSYLIVLIISFVALIILVDTLKTPIINVFPGAEMILFNLFETLQDIKLFIIDLS
jgi:predicted Zn finger-like uncharacterized protein